VHWASNLTYLTLSLNLLGSRSQVTLFALYFSNKFCLAI
jgi:hypothetical protein